MKELLSGAADFLLPVSTSEQVIPPTELTLFSFSPEEALGQQIRQEVYERFLSEGATTAASYRQLIEGLRDRDKRLLKTGREMEKQYIDLNSSRTVSLFYLCLGEEFPNLSAPHLLDFFGRSLSIVTRIFDQSSKDPVSLVNGISLMSTLVSLNHTDNIFTRTVKEMAGEKPDWFVGDQAGWIKLVGERASFARYLNPDLVSKTPQDYLLVGQRFLREGRHGYAFSDALPDWWMERDGQDFVPDKKKINTEYNADTQEAASTVEKIKAIQKERHGLDQTAAEQYQQIQQQLSDLTRHFCSIQTFADIFLPIACFEQLERLQALLSLGVSPTKEQEKEINERAEQGSKNSINKVAALPGFFSSPQMVALRLEECLKQTGMIGSVKDQWTKDIETRLRAVLQDVEVNPDQVGADLKEKKQTDKAAYRAEVYTLRPLLEFLSSEDRKLILELGLVPDPGQNGLNRVETAIYELAYFISSGMEKIIGDVPITVRQNAAQLRREVLGKTRVGSKETIDKQIDFTKKWLGRNRFWAYQECLRAADLSFQGDSAIEESSQAVIPDFRVDRLTGQRLEIENKTAEVSAGKLAGWELYYVFQGRSSRELVRIEGQTTKEIDEFLKDFLRKNRIPNTVKEQSITSALEWEISEVPAEVDYTRIGLVYGGVRYYKLRRNDMRIVFTIDREEKKLVFWLTKKRADSYDYQRASRR